MKGTAHADVATMAILMILAGLLATMNVYVDQLSDIRWSINDLYMAVFMAGWMLLFMGLYYHGWGKYTTWGLVFIVIAFICIRTQLFVGSGQYATAMIPHHSMAVFMSRRLLQKMGGPGGGDRPEEVSAVLDVAQHIIPVQKQEIQIFKGVTKPLYDQHVSI